MCRAVRESQAPPGQARDPGGTHRGYGEHPKEPWSSWEGALVEVSALERNNRESQCEIDLLTTTSYGPLSVDRLLEEPVRARDNGGTAIEVRSPYAYFSIVV